MDWLNRHAILALCYATNIRSLRPSRDDLGPFGNTWSLACEEQFYIIWSLVLPLIFARGYKMRTFLMVSITGTLFFIRVWASMYPGAIYDVDWRAGVWANVWKMLIGASLRLLPVPSLLLRRPFAYIGLFGLAALLGATTLSQPDYSSIAPGWSNPMFAIMTWIDLFTAFFTMLILCGINGARGGISVLEVGPLRFVGRISYSLYLWQVPLIAFNEWKRGYPGLGDTAIAFVLATCSSLYVEEPIMRAYKRWKAKRDQL
jgi:peptidoglycan/LPS O-acetylase OafA/YrhL